MKIKKTNILISILLIISVVIAFSFYFKNNIDIVQTKIDYESKLDNIDFVSNIGSTAKKDILPYAKSGGINLGLYNINGQIEKEFNFNLKENESIKKYISLGNMIDKERIYKLLLFVDYKQAPFSVDGRVSSKDFTFKLDPGQSTEIPFEIAPLEKGLHDILFVIVKYPDEKSLDDDFRKNTDMNNLLFLRFSVVVENESTNQIAFNEYGEIAQGDLLDGVYLSKENDFKRWLSHKVKKGTNESYYIHLGNNHKKGDRTYALIALHDWRQVSIGDSGKETLFFKLKEAEMVSLRSNISEKYEEGIYDISTILIHNPYQKCTISNRQVETGVRVGIKVK